MLSDFTLHELMNVLLVQGCLGEVSVVRGQGILCALPHPRPVLCTCFSWMLTFVQIGFEFGSSAVWDLFLSDGTKTSVSQGFGLLPPPVGNSQCILCHCSSTQATVADTPD